MKFAISGQDESLSSPVACHFGRCCYFHIYDDETDTTELIENCDKNDKTCAGEAAFQCLMERKVGHIISANFGQKVQQEMNYNGIRMTLLTDCSKSVSDIIRIIKHKHYPKTI